MKEKNNKRGGRTPIPGIDELLLMERNPLPPAYEHSPAKDDSEQEPEGKKKEDFSATKDDEKDIKRNTVGASMEQRDIIKASPFLSKLIAYDDEYSKRTKVVDRKTVMIDTDIQNAIESLNLKMSKQNIINAMLSACIAEHCDDLRKIKKKNTLL